jgi:hypothetical protein
MIDEPIPHKSNRLKSPVRMYREARDPVAVVHAPSFSDGEIAAYIPATQQRRVRTHIFVAGRIKIIVVNTENKRICRVPVESKRFDGMENTVCHPEIF